MSERRSSAVSEQPVAWIVERIGDPTFPMFIRTKADADRIVAHVNCTPLATAHPLFRNVPQSAGTESHSPAAMEGEKDTIVNLIHEHVGFEVLLAIESGVLTGVEDAAEAILAELSRRSQAVSDEWQLIDTAPKDGTIIDLWWVRNDGSEKSYRRPDCRWAEHMGGWVWEGIWNGTTPKNWTATHWMPRPKPPLTRPQCATPSSPDVSAPAQRLPE